MLLKSLLIWLAVIPLAILNGGLRERVLTPLMGEKLALPLSGLILCSLIFLVSLIFVPKLGKGTQKIYILMGFLWIAATILFEFGLGMFMGESLSNMIKSYDITTGNLWSVVVLFTGFTPWLTAKVKHII